MGGQRSARTRAIEDFAAVLSELRDSVGTPSFRAMSGRSGAISHTTLHEAAQGNRLPSWETTVEFVRACGATPDDYRERWERAHATVCSSRAVAPARRTEPAPETVPGTARGTAPHRSPRHEITLAIDEAPAMTPGMGAAPDTVPPDLEVRFTRWHAAVAAAMALVLVAGAVVAWSVLGGDAASRAQPLALMASECPVNQKNPPPKEPTHEGDQAAFITDVTLPDCTHVPEGKTLTKTWRFKNTGTVPWDGYTLHRIDLPQQAGQCQTIPDVPIPRTGPGHVVDIDVAVTTPRRPTFCFVRFKMHDAEGAVAFPGSRPVYFQVIVD